MICGINVVTGAGAIALLGMSLWPGYAGGCLFLLALPVIALLGIGWLVAVVRTKPRLIRQVLLAPVLVCLTYGLLKFYIPRRVVFLAFQSRFDSYVPSAPTSEYADSKLDRWIGIYYVDK